MFFFYILTIVGRVVIFGSVIVAMIMIAAKVDGKPRLFALLGFGAILVSEIAGIGLQLVATLSTPPPPAMMLMSVITGVVRITVQLLVAIGIALVGWAAVSAHRSGAGVSA